MLFVLCLQVYSSEGRLSFTSHTHGEHVICLYSNSTKWFSGTQLVRSHLLSYSSEPEQIFLNFSF